MTDDRTRLVVVVLSTVLALGCAAMAVAHSGVGVPFLSRFGPGGDRPVPPAVAAFIVATIALALVAGGTARRRPWAWALGVLVHGLVVLGAAVPFRGIGSLVAIVVSAAAFGLLVSPPGRRALLTT